MNIPQIWVKAESKIAGPQGPMALTAWGWSDTDRAEAARLASERLRSLVSRIQQSQELQRSYAYGSRPLREEIIQEIRSQTGEIIGIVTRNSYGCLVLNTSEAMFVDIDLPTNGVVGRIWNLFGKKRDVDKEYADKIKTQLSGISTASFRIYRTAAGFRLLFTDRLFKPGSSAVEAIMSAVSADPAYAKLCRVQESFRARLTPKPWRCDTIKPPNSHPREEDFEKKQFAAWLDEYERKVSGRRTCRLIESVNGGRIHERVQPILDLHDAETKVNLNVTLA